MSKIPKIIISKNDLEQFKEKLDSIKEIEEENKINVGIPIIISENIPEGHYIIDNGNEMCIYYPDGKMVKVDGLTDHYKLPYSIKPKN